MKYLQKEQKATVLSKALSRSEPAVFQEMKDGCSKDTKGCGGIKEAGDTPSMALQATDRIWDFILIAMKNHL